jgi:cyclopropane-fatty-acyl-phospholipid synthase
MMRDTIIPSGRKRELHPMPAGLSGMIASAARKALFVRLETIETGNIVIHEGQSFTSFGTRKSGEPLKAAIVVHDKSFYTDIAFGGSIGAAESYVAGSWSTDDLTKLIRIIILNRHVLAGIEGGKARLSVPFHRLLHLLRKNTVSGSRKNIAAHYDLGNEFYSLFLDESMTYSCGIFMNRHSSLHDASIAKYDRICRKLLLSGDDHVLEVGGGWGGFAIHAARHYGCRVTTTTISKEQYEYARKQVYQEGLGGRIKIIMEDYRDLNGLYDKLVSIEMIEPVRHHFL